jgi:hypothetical protein
MSCKQDRISARYNPSMPSVDHWAGVAPEARFFTKTMDELLATTTETSEELLDRARDLRAKAASTDIEGFRSAYLKIALRYEQTAAARVASA